MNGNNYVGPLVQLIVTAALAALAAFSGLKVGNAESRATIIQMEGRLTRIEQKLDWLMVHQIDIADHKASSR